MKIKWLPQPGPQLDAFQMKMIPELLFGGAKFGGKSDFLLGDFGQDVEQFGPNWYGILLRQSMPEFKEIERRSYQIYGDCAEYKVGEHTWRFHNGARLHLRFLETVKDFWQYNGSSYTWIGFDEIGQWPTLEGYHMMKGCLRWAEANVHCKRIRASANPGGPGHNEVKEYFKIAEYPQGRVLIEDKVTKLTRVFVPSFVQDNKIGLANDPEYILRLQTVGNEALVRAWLTGDWSVVTGAYFADRLTVFEPFELPSHWLRFRSMDWGSSKPFSVGWWAVSDGQSFKVRGWDREEKEVFLPPNCLVLYREWYGAKSANIGLKLTAREVARGIKKRSAEDYTYSVADPSIFTQDGGPSIAEEMAAEGVLFKRADRDRPPGWEQFRMRLRGFEGHPMLVVFSTCLDFIRTIPTLQHDVHKPEDLDTEGEDHTADMARYAMMSRPWMFKKAEVKSEDPWNVGNFVEAHFNKVDRHKRL